MADFELPQQEIQNLLDQSDNSVVIADPTNNTYRAAVTAAGELRVIVTGGGSAGQLVTDGQTAAGGDVGRLVAGYDGTDYQFLSVNSSGRLQVDIISGAGGQQYADGATIGSTVGTVAMGTDGTNLQYLKVDSAGELQIDILTLPAITGTVTANQGGTWTVQPGNTANTTAWLFKLDQTGSNNDVDVLTQPVRSHSTDSIKVGDGTDFLAINTDGSALVDVIDRPARDMGKIDIAAFDVSLPTGDNRIGRIKITDDTNIANVLDDSGIGRLRVEAKIAAGGASQQVRIVGNSDIVMDVAKDVTRPANTRALLIAGLDQDDVVRYPTVTRDTVDSKDRIEVVGKVSVSSPPVPASATAVTIDASSPLSVATTSTTNYTIPNGVTFNLSSVTVGSEGDPNERGSKVEVFYVDSSSVTHIVERIYISGFTIQTYPDTKISRDGTSMVGNGTTTQIRVVRTRLGGSSVELDVVVRGFEE